MIKFIKPNDNVVQFIADNMRNADRVEVMASHGHTPLQALKTSLQQSHFATVVIVDNEPCVMFGLVRYDILSGSGSPWMLGAWTALKHRREFLKQTPRVIDDMLKICPYLSNHVHIDNTTCIQWLKWLGFTIEDPAPYGVANELFHRFHLRKG